MLARLQSLLGDTSGTTLTLTGILGLAAVVYALYHLRAAQGGRKPDEHGQQHPYDPARPSTSAAAAAAAGGGSAHAAWSAAAATPAASIARRLAGIRRVTMSVPGVLLEESGPDELEESASLRPGVADLVADVARTAELYLMCHVGDDVGEAVVRGAMEHAGVLGSRAGQIAPHRLLFCGTLDGKVSLVRQLEPQLHIDAHPKTVFDLQRFVKQLVLVGQQPGDSSSSLAGSSGAGLSAANVQHAASLAAALGVPGS